MMASRLSVYEKTVRQKMIEQKISFSNEGENPVTIMDLVEISGLLDLSLYPSGGIASSDQLTEDQITM